MPDRKMIVKNGVAVASGNMMRPPLRITQKGSSVLINSYQVYPIPKALPSDSDGEYPKLQALIKKMENDLMVLDNPSYDEQVDRVTGYCKDAGYEPKITDCYQDVVVETKPGVGRILLINNEKLAASLGLMEPTLGDEDKTADSFFDALAEQLQSGGMVLFGRGFLSVVPNAHVAKTVIMIDKIAQRAKVTGKMSGEMLFWQRDMDVTAAVFRAELADEYPAEKLALITFHTDIWDVFLQTPPPSYPFLLAMRDLSKQGLITTVLDDYAITVSAWDSWLKKGARLYHNMSHGDIVEGEVVIKVGNDRWGKPTHYFNASHIKSLELQLPKSIIYNYSCYSLENPSMANAFVTKGASVYIGWTAPTSARSSFIDKVEEKVWAALIDSNKNVAETIALIHNQSIVPMEVNGIVTDLRFHGDGDARLQEKKQ